MLHHLQTPNVEWGGLHNIPLASAPNQPEDQGGEKVGSTRFLPRL